MEPQLEQGEHHQEECECSSRACKTTTRGRAEVAKADWAPVPAQQMEEVQQSECVPRGQQAGGCEGDKWMDKDPHNNKEDQGIKGRYFLPIGLLPLAETLPSPIVGLLPTLGLLSSLREMQFFIGESGAELGVNTACILDFTVFVGATSCHLILSCNIGQ
ncbi:unnamed protein product [Camellia sinensis]